MIFVLFCNYLFFDINDCVYINDLEEEIGICFFIIRYKGCDFVVIKINEVYIDSCNVVFRRDDKMKINVNIYFSRLEIGNIVYKVGVLMGVINGIIISLEFYLKIIDECNWENVFFVKGIIGNFLKKGDSGLLVF